PDGMAVDPATGVVAWRPTANQLGDHDVILRVSDGKGGVDLQQFRVTVFLDNTAPVITSTPVSPVGVGLPYQYPVRAQDADGDPISFRLDAGTGNMAIDPATGLLTYTATASEVGTHHIAITALDGRGGEFTQAFDLSVVGAAPNSAPTIDSTPRTVVR